MTVGIDEWPEVVYRLMRVAEHEPLLLPWRDERLRMCRLPRQPEPDRGVRLRVTPRWAEAAVELGGDVELAVCAVAAQQYYRTLGAEVELKRALTGRHVAVVSGSPLVLDRLPEEREDGWVVVRGSEYAQGCGVLAVAYEPAAETVCLYGWAYHSAVSQYVRPNDTGLIAVPLAALLAPNNLYISRRCDRHAHD